MEVKLRRISKRMSNHDVLMSQLRLAVEQAMRNPHGLGWNYSIDNILIPTQRNSNDEWEFEANLTFINTTDRQSVIDKFPRILKRLAIAGQKQNLKKTPWIIVNPTGYENQTEVISEGFTTVVGDPGERNLGSINLEVNGNFDHIYGRDPHIRLILDALNLAERTDFSKRSHSILYGLPGCGKSEICKAVADLIGIEGESYLWFDAPNMTRAGAVEQLMNISVVPPILFIEEIEKVDESALRFLLGIMDHRGEIRRTNYRVGNQFREARMVVIATANNLKLLKGLMSGALYSRFQNRIYCPRPDREIMTRILRREVLSEEVKGKEEWIEPALQFCFDKHKIFDPRIIVNDCLVGADRLLDGSYQKDREATMQTRLESKNE